MFQSSSLAIVAVFCAVGLSLGCSGSDSAPDDSSDDALATGSTRVANFLCTVVSSTATDDHLKATRLDISIDTTAAGKPTGNLITGLEYLHKPTAVGFGVSHERDVTQSGHKLSEFKLAFGEEDLLPGSTGGTLTVPASYLKFRPESSAALNVVTLEFEPSNATATYRCKKDTRRENPGPAPDPLQFSGAAKTSVAHDSCAKDVASAVMDDVVERLEDHGVDVPDTFVFTTVDRTNTGYKTVVNDVSVPVEVSAGCHIDHIDDSGF